jgi:hypothetical protein
MYHTIRSRVFILFALTLLSGCGYTSYEECLLDEMKGQIQSMQSTAEQVCENKFPYEKQIYSFRDGKWDISWSNMALDSIKIKIISNETRYRITRAEIKFSEIECSKAKPIDFSNAVAFKFETNGTAKAYSTEAVKFKCMREDSVFGILEN